MNTLLVMAALVTFTAQEPLSLDKQFNDALGVAGLNTSTARFDQEILGQYAQGEFESMLFRGIHGNPWRTPFILDMYRVQIAGSKDDPLATVSTLSRLTGEGSRRGLLGSPITQAETLASEPGSLRKALIKLRGEGLLADPVPATIDAPANVQKAAALMIYTALDAVRYRRAAFANGADLQAAFSRETTVQPSEDDPQVYQELVYFYRSVEMHYLFAAGQDVVAASARARELIADTQGSEKYDFKIRTSWGLINLSGGDDSTYNDETTFLSIDTGGSDTYVNPASNRSISNWMSVCIDSDGDDKYVSDIGLVNTSLEGWAKRKEGRASPGPSSATFGVSVLIDSKGSDTYRSHKSGLGSATFGVAMLIDMEGADTYDAYGDAQGFGKFGIGILEDHAGNDVYRGFTQVQGVGLTGGIGALIDRAGDDDYIANDTVIDFPSSQSPKHNVSMAQGAGYGFRSDYLTGHSLSGGVGILLDQSGSDEYECAVFGQGTGYWEGVGVLWDEKGDDSYHGLWYVQGAAAHFAVGYLEDFEGNDTFVADMNMAQGAGHDFSSGFLIDRAGDDSYKAPNLSLGGGNANGIGVFVDAAGKDTYETQGTTLGKGNAATAGSIRERGLCLGIFLDLGGRDVYPSELDWAKEGARVANWTDRRTSVAESQLGIFWDSGR